MSVQTEVTSAAPAVRRELLRVDDLSGGFRSDDGGFTEILKSVSFSIEAGTITAVVGETGSGKSMTALAVMGLLPRGFRRTAGAVHFEGRDLLALAPAQLRAIRGVRIGMVFQDARAALNPVFTIGQQLADVWRAHHRSSKREAWRVATEALDRVKIPEPGRRVKQYPHEFSGGMAQRAMLAMAMISDPSLLILDEPTTGLDVTIQADVMELIVELARSSALTTCLITHDLGVVAQTCDNVVVMQDGGVRETGTCEQIFTAAADPYTRRLITASRMGEGRA